MDYILNGLIGAIEIILSLNSEFMEIVGVSVKLSVISTIFATIIGIILGTVIYHNEFYLKKSVITVLNTLMSLPTVVVGLTVYSFLSRKGPFGEWGLLFTQSSVIIGQIILILPITTSLTISALKGLDKRLKTTLITLSASRKDIVIAYLNEARYGILSAVIVAFGRVFSEVGVSMMLGGNIRNYTRTITTAIALETSKGEFELGIALGIVLLSVSFSINIIFSLLKNKYSDLK